jgi:hypothetical protein
MGMGLLRWLLRLVLLILWPWHRRRKDDEAPKRRRAKKHADGDHQGVYRIEVDNELGRFHGDSYAFSFWSSSRIILILSVLLWWIQPAGPMIAGYVGGRRAGSPWKAVVAALLPVAVILLANYAYGHNVAVRQIDFVASLPLVLGDGVASVLPFLAPYRDFLVAYLQSFVEALRTTFGMGTNGYLMVVLFAYIGGLIGEQTRRELAVRQGTSQSVGLNFLTPFFHPRPVAYAHDVDEGDADDEDDGPRPRRRPVRAVAHAGSGHRKARRSGSTRFEDMRKLSADPLRARGEGRSGRVRHRVPEDEDDETEDEEPEPVRRRRPVARADVHRDRDLEEDEEPRRGHPDPKERHAPKPRSREEEIAIQRFVERALRNYDKSRL